VASLGGGGSATSTTRGGGSEDERQAALNFAKCMRQDVINLPDPQVSADGIDQQPHMGMRAVPLASGMPDPAVTRR
jgi:hypothetical protein